MDLDQLRQRLNQIDREFLELMAERQSVVEQVSRLKLSSGQATRDYAREKQVLDQARADAQELGIAPDIAAEVMRLLIRTSLTRQENARVRAEGRGDGQRALVIGGSGKMGRWFAVFLDSQGYRVTIADPVAADGSFAHVTDWQAATGDFAVTVIAAPLTASADILRQMAATGHAGLIFDVGSLKTPLIEPLRALAAAGAQVTSVHPMFGPDTELLSDKHVIFLDAGCARANAAARELFASTMAQQSDMTLEDHDRLIAYVLGLSHAVNIVFFSVLANSGEAVPRLADISSTTFDAQLAVAVRVANENPELYFEIQSLNEFGLEPLEALSAAVEQITATVRNHDAAAFVAMMQAGRRYLASRS
ncbi:MAG: prephenate dehydrogenase/arogenate dehydrogenase family protein [Gammaproteobacteria bacterium]|jgi:chorismate mutase/prephenate dehydrogenase|nr:prephenate dehydrogenase/arogenate dehydrogenase family protein [Gammaproteobacteria bacterium]